MVILNIKDYGRIVIELDYGNAPNTCANFVELARSGFYNNLTFHRIIKGFMIQGGDPLGNGMGGPDYSIKGEFKVNGFNNNISHLRGVISMARSYQLDSAGSQFFIMHQNGEYLDGQYASFGKVIEGMEVVDRIANVKTTRNDRPIEKVIIESCEVIDEAIKEVIKIK